MGELISAKISGPIESISARGYNFQFCKNIFISLQNKTPSINDTHPADLRYCNPNNAAKLYAGWQSGAIQLMKDDKVHSTYRGSLIEVDTMDSINQINDLDEGALLAIGTGVTPPEGTDPHAKEIQEAMKIIDDYSFCSLEPTGLIYAWGITKEKVPVVFKGVDGQPIITKQHAIVVGNQHRSGANV